MSTFYAPTSELYHYGVIGMKWGVRKSSGITKKEIRSDNKQAFLLGKEGTISSRAHHYAKRGVKRLEKKIAKADEKGKDLTKLQDKLKISKSVEKITGREEKAAISAINAHRNSLISKYGQTNVSDIKIDENGRVNERVATGKQFATSVVASIGLRAAAVSLGSPVALTVRPKFKAELGNDRYQQRYKAAKRKYKGKQ